MAGGEKTVTEFFDREEGEPMGVETDETLMVTRVQAGTVADGKMNLGDVIKKVNGHTVNDKNHFYQLLQKCYPTNLTVVRNDTLAEKLAASQLPQNLEKMVHRRSGFEYPLTEVDCTKFPGKQLGLTLATRYHKVYVTQARAGTIAGNFFKVGDRVIILNGAPVSDREVAKKLIVNSGGRFQAVVERPANDSAVREVRQVEITYKAEAAKAALAAKTCNMPSDIVNIVTEARKKNKDSKSEESEGPKRILKRTPSNSNRNLTFSPGHQEVAIASDVDPAKRLRNVPRS